MVSRREFLGNAVAATAAAATTAPAIPSSATTTSSRSNREALSLCGQWKFSLDPQNVGVNESWFVPAHSADWLDVIVPHTWQIDPVHADYRGVAWYQREFDVLPAWRNAAVRIEFEAVFHSATVWVNGQLAGEHLRKGYTAFWLDITLLLRWGHPNTITVRVDSAFNNQMLPRGRSSDWAHDGGIYRPVHLLVTPKTYTERVAVDTVPDLTRGGAALSISAYCRNAGAKPWNGTASFRVIDEETGLTVVASQGETFRLTIPAGKDHTITLKSSLPQVKLWHFDSPHLYRLAFVLDSGDEAHQLDATFGVRKFEIRNGQFHLNGEPVRLMGVEHMAGSNPDFGMAEPLEWIERDHRDLKHLNCVFSRVHWPQDKRVLNYCDRHGILMQSEIPAWGPDTFQGMGAQPDPTIMENGLQQLREMISRDYNHPSIIVWGLCNEIGGQNPPAFQFAKRILAEAKRLDPGRLCSYASNSLDATPENDVAVLMDFVETNEYFGTWAPGTAEDTARYLDSLHAAFPNKPIVVSEYGYCACAPDRPEGDARRIEILRTHDAAFRSKDFIAGTIFFCYNDYRTQAGESGIGVLQQRVHGVVDVYGAPKPSRRILREELSPVESLTVENERNAFHLVLQTRGTLPGYSLRGYKLVGVLYGQGNIPIELQEVAIPEVLPGKTATLDLRFSQSEAPLRVRFDVMRPTGFSAHSVDWSPDS